MTNATQPATPTPFATTIAITSGKGGVGKTSLATNLAIALSRAGSRTCLMDADMGLANVNILLGLRPAVTVEDVIQARARLADAFLEGPDGVRILPAASDVARLATATSGLAPAADELAAMERRLGYLLVDTPAGAAPTTLDFLAACDHTVLTITQEPTSLTDAFSLLKALKRRGHEGRLWVIANMLPRDRSGQRLFERFRAAASRYLQLRLDYLGNVHMDPSVTRAVLTQTPLLTSTPGSPAATAIAAMAAHLRTHAPEHTGSGRFAAYWRPRDTDHQGTHPATPPPAPAADTGIITPPRPTREAARAERDDDATGPSTEELAATLARRLRGGTLDEAIARQCLASVEAGFSRHYRRSASDLKSVIYRVMMHGGLSATEQKRLIGTLVDAYRRGQGEAGQVPAPSLTHPTRARLAARLSERQQRLEILRTHLDHLARDDAELMALLEDDERLPDPGVSDQ